MLRAIENLQLLYVVTWCFQIHKLSPLEAVIVVSDMLTTLYLFQVSLCGNEGIRIPDPLNVSQML